MQNHYWCQTNKHEWYPRLFYSWNAFKNKVSCVWEKLFHCSMLISCCVRREQTRHTEWRYTKRIAVQHKNVLVYSYVVTISFSQSIKPILPHPTPEDLDPSPTLQEMYFRPPDDGPNSVTLPCNVFVNRRMHVVVQSNALEFVSRTLCLQCNQCHFDFF